MKKNKKKRTLKDKLLNLAIVLLFLGGLFLVAKPYVLDYLNEQKAQANLELLQKQADIDAKRKALAKKDLYNGLDVEEITKEAYQNADAKEILFDYGIGKIDFIEQKIAVPIVEGVTNQALLVGAGTLKPNQEVGKGNFSLAAHRLASRRSILFSQLKNITKGEHVTVTIGDKKATYVITDKKVITPTEMEYIDDSQGDGLVTLICCTDDSINRWMVRGKLV